MFSGTLKYDSINLLTGPAADYSTSATVNADAETSVLAKSDDGTMVFVETAGGSGWVSVDLITYEGDADALPVWQNAMENAKRV